MPALSVANGTVYAAGENGTLYALGTETATTQTATPTAQTATPDGGGSAGGTATPTATAVDPAPTRTATATPAPVASGSSGTDPTVLAGVGGAVVGSVLLAAYLRGRGGSDDPGPAGGAAAGPPNGAGPTPGERSGSDRSDASDEGEHTGPPVDADAAADDEDVDARLDAARRAFEEGRAASDRGDRETAAERLEAAVEGFGAVLAAVEDEETEERVRDDLAEAKAALASATDATAALEEVSDLLAGAESDMENAVDAFVNDQRTVARVRFRQARGRYERAVERLEEEGVERPGLSVPVTTDETLPDLDSFDAVPGVDPDTVEALEEAGYETLSDLRTASLDDLRTVTGVDEESVTRLAVASWQTVEDSRRFDAIEDVQARLEAAETGYRAC
jgi:hypothetical protein